MKQLHQSDVFILPSYLDSWGMVVIEAMACGLPVIITENTGAKTAVDVKSGFVIPVDDRISIEEKILFFYHNRPEIERRGRKAHEQAQKYTWDRYHKELEDCVKQIELGLKN